MTKGNQRSGWKAGQSGNPNGRPPGSSEVGRLREAIANHLPKIIEQLVAKAEDGDTQAARLLLERVLPPVRPVESAVMLDMPKEATLTEQGQIVVRAVADGTVAPSQGAALLSGLGGMARLKELDELTSRIDALEKRHAQP